MGNAITVLWSWFKEFIPALKVECMIVGFGLMAMALCLAEVCWTSGLRGPLSYLILSPGITVPAFLAGIALVAAALLMKPVPYDQM